MINFMQSAINDVSQRNVYGAAPGSSIGNRSTAVTPYSRTIGGATADMTANGGVTGTDKAAALAGTGSLTSRPFTWWLVMVALLIGVVIAARKTGNGEDFRNIRGSVWNVLFITLTATVGILALKQISNVVAPGSAFTTTVNAA